MHASEREERFTGWLARHRGLLLKVTRSFARKPHDQDDLFQEIAFQVWKSVPRYVPHVAETTWLYRVALYTAIDWSRKEKTREDRVREFDMGLVADVAATSKNDPRVEWLYDKIAELEAVDRSLTLLLLDGFSYREMSLALGLTESNVGVRINRIKKKLSEKLSREKEHVL